MTMSTKSPRIQSFIVGLTIAVFLLTLTSSVEAYVYLKEVTPYSNKCPFGRNEYKVGERWYDDELCEKYECVKSRKLFYIHTSGCGTVSAGKDCTVDTGVGHYPKCCPVVHCMNPIDEKLRKDSEIIYPEQQI